MDPGRQPFRLLTAAAWVVEILVVSTVDVCGGCGAEVALATLPIVGANVEGVVLRCTCAEDDPLLGVVDGTSDGPLASVEDVCEGCEADSAALETQLLGHGWFAGVNNLQVKTSVAFVKERLSKVQRILEFDLG